MVRREAIGHRLGRTPSSWAFDFALCRESQGCRFIRVPSRESLWIFTDCVLAEWHNAQMLISAWSQGELSSRSSEQENKLHRVGTSLNMSGSTISDRLDVKKLLLKSGSYLRLLKASGRLTQAKTMLVMDCALGSPPSLQAQGDRESSNLRSTRFLSAGVLFGIWRRRQSAMGRRGTRFAT
jgi:hypothetical protein